MAEAWPAPAKLNLMLHITGRRDDGYHLLQTVFQFLDFGDELSFSPRADGCIEHLSPLPGVAPEADLVVRAARLLQQHSGTGTGVTIRIDKRLPMGGGLGGGSSDAATTLVALNRLWDLDLDEAQLCRLGLSLGADVPVFIHGRATWAEGVGERFTDVELPEPWYVVLVPGISVSTAMVFQDAELTRDCPPITIRDFLAGRCVNVCEPVVRQAYPEVARALDWLGRYGAARMTGTGACVYLPVDSREQAEQVLAQKPARWGGFCARGRNRSPLSDRLSRPS